DRQGRQQRRERPIPHRIILLRPHGIVPPLSVENLNARRRALPPWTRGYDNGPGRGRPRQKAATAAVEIRCRWKSGVEIRCQFIILARKDELTSVEIRCQFIILARKDELTSRQ